MDLLFLLAVLLTFVSAEYGEASPAAAPVMRGAVLLLGLFLLLTFHIRMGDRLAARLAQRPSLDASAQRRLQRTQTFGRFAWFGFVLFALLIAEWPRLVAFNWGLRHTIFFRDLMLLLPVVGSWWLALICQFRTRYRIETLSNAEKPMAVLRRATYSAATVARITCGLTILPILAVLAFRDLVTSTIGSVSEDTVAYITVASVPLLALGFPLVLCCAWRTRPLVGPLRTRIETAACEARVRLRAIRIWETGGLVRNAAMAGLGGGFRCVFLTDGLLAHLNDEEVEWVVRHELGHARRHHLRWRLLCAFAPLGPVLSLAMAYPAAADRCATVLQEFGPYGPLGVAVGITLLVLLYLTTAFAWHARQLELDADLFALGSPASVTDACGPADPVGCYIATLVKLEGRPVGETQAQGQHPSLFDREAFLRSATASPVFAQRFRRRLVGLHTALTAVALSPLGVALPRLLFARLAD